jgi:hypothetical protein
MFVLLKKTTQDASGSLEGDNESDELAIALYLGTHLISMTIRTAFLRAIT